MLPRMNVETIPYVKPMINIGAGFDIPTGNFLKGVHGQMVFNGGLGNLQAIVGIGNTFKSTIEHYMMVSAVARMGEEATLETYDTEVNIQPWHLSEMAKSVERVYRDEPSWIDTGRWRITNAALMIGDKWYDVFKEFLQAKIKDKKKYMVETPFEDGFNPGNPMKMIYPSYQEVDSLSKFATSDVTKMQDDNSLGDSGANTIHMRQGLQKTRFLDEIPNLAVGSNTYIMLTAHFGEKIEMDPRNPSMKLLQHVKQGQKIKGVPQNFTFLMDNCWQTLSSTVLQNGDKTTLYPRTSDDKFQGDQDLNFVTLKQLRSKSGPSGIVWGVVVSQKEGVLPSLTEFHFLKTSQRFGLPGNDQNYVCCLCPDIKLSRTKIRQQLDKHPRLRRAVNILSEYLQMRTMWHGRLESKYFMDPQDIYDKIKEAGYDWDFILEHTRGWWTINQKDHQLELSTLDILRMALGEYHPYWLEDDKKTVKKQYAKLLKEVEHVTDEETSES